MPSNRSPTIWGQSTENTIQLPSSGFRTVGKVHCWTIFLGLILLFWRKCPAPGLPGAFGSPLIRRKIYWCMMSRVMTQWIGFKNRYIVPYLGFLKNGCDLCFSNCQCSGYKHLVENFRATSWISVRNAKNYIGYLHHAV